MIKIFTKIITISLLMICMHTHAYNFNLYNDENKPFEKEFVRIFPNPMVSTATIKLSKEIDLDAEKTTLTFYNLMGKEVYRISNISEDVFTITKDKFAPGIYFYQLRSNNKVLSSGRITVK